MISTRQRRNPCRANMVAAIIRVPSRRPSSADSVRCAASPQIIHGIPAGYAATSLSQTTSEFAETRCLGYQLLLRRFLTSASAKHADQWPNQRQPKSGRRKVSLRVSADRYGHLSHGSKHPTGSGVSSSSAVGCPVWGQIAAQWGRLSLAPSSTVGWFSAELSVQA